MKKAYSEFVCWKEKLYGEIIRALGKNDKSALRKLKIPLQKESAKSR